ncbi:hypothetical protein [Ktedonospora formicarum]|uniref:Uncharacterized protein n=1 Tax=Ktedonospora formicarum TaxID=2778364 RepID=A0A8J3MV68_9CHLR|nr:hypothetical protein [Ktedonospora formicarum]GHO48985.1 hypothetical protein KSX_71480 [Ktedonospora formicarum]
MSLPAIGKSLCLVMLSVIVAVVFVMRTAANASAASLTPTKAQTHVNTTQGGPWGGYGRFGPWGEYGSSGGSGEYDPIKQYLFEHRSIMAKSFSGYDPITQYQYTHDPYYRACLDRGGTMVRIPNSISFACKFVHHPGPYPGPG